MNAERLLEHFETISETPDAVARMRRFILDLAVRGKLVEQDPEDEPAEELLKAISLDSLQSKGRKTTAAGCPGIAIEGSFAVPDSWAWTLLGGIGDWGSGSTPPRGRADYYSGDISWFKSGELGDNKSLSDSEEKITHLALGECSFRNNKPGDILVAMYGATIGKLAILAEEAVTNQAVCACTPCWGVDTQYLYLFLLAKRDDFRLASEGGAQPNISKVKIVNTPVPLPPLAEQHRIVAKVDELMALCDQLEAARQEREQGRVRLMAATLQRLNQPAEDPASFRKDASFALQVLPSLTTTPAQIKQLRQTILNLAVRGKLVEQDPEDEPAEDQLERIIFAKLQSGRKQRVSTRKPENQALEPLAYDLGSGWVTASLADLVSILNGRAYKQAELLDAGTPVLRVGNLFTSNKWYYSNLELDDDKYIDNGDLIFAWSASFGPFIWGKGRVVYHYHIWKLPLHSPPDLSRDYLYLYLLHKTAEIKDAGHGISMVHMTKEKMEVLDVPLPPLAEQHRIVAKVDELMAFCDQLEQQLSQADQQRRRLLEAVLAEALAETENSLVAAYD